MVSSAQDTPFIYGEGVCRSRCGRRFLHLGRSSCPRTRPYREARRNEIGKRTGLGYNPGHYVGHSELRHSHRKSRTLSIFSACERLTDLDLGQRPRLCSICPPSQGCFLTSAAHDPVRLCHHQFHRHHRLLELQSHLRPRDLVATGPIESVPRRERRKWRHSIRRLRYRSRLHSRSTRHKRRCEFRERGYRSDSTHAALPEYPPRLLHLRCHRPPHHALALLR